MGIISYAQNFEDVLLHRALSDVEQGFYIDIGAQHPVEDSVSHAFYQRGWRGVHVEPVPAYARLLREHRPDEQVIEAVIDAHAGEVTFFEVTGTGLSTASAEIAALHRDKGHEIVERRLPAITLDDLLSRVAVDTVHWMKIDVEGFERAALSGWKKSRVRPRVIVVESTFPNSQVDTHQEWQSLLLGKGYLFAYADGLNRFYVSKAHAKLREVLQYGANVFDGYQLDQSCWSTRLVTHQVEGRMGELLARTRQDLDMAVTRHAEEMSRQTDHFDRRLEETRFDAEVELSGLRRDCEARLTRALSTHAELRAALMAAGADAHAERQRLVHDHGEAEARSAARLLELEKEAQRLREGEGARIATLSEAHAAREVAWSQESAQWHDRLERAGQQLLERERSAADTIDRVRRESHEQVQQALRELLERERHLAAQFSEQVAASARDRTEREASFANRMQEERDAHAAVLSRLHVASQAASLESDRRLSMERARAEQALESIRVDFLAQLERLNTETLELAGALEASRQTLREQSGEFERQREALEAHLVSLRRELAHAHDRESSLHTTLVDTQAVAAAAHRSLDDAVLDTQRREAAFVVQRTALEASAREAVERAHAARAATDREWQARWSAHNATVAEQSAAAAASLEHIERSLQAETMAHADARLTVARLGEEVATGAAARAELQVAFEQQSQLVRELEVELTAIQKSLTYRWTAAARRLFGLPTPVVHGPRAVPVPARSGGTSSDPNGIAAPSTLIASPDLTRQPMAVNHVDDLLKLRGQRFLTEAYLAVLGRMPDPQGLDYYGNRLAAGYGREHILAQIGRSQEARAHAAKLPGLAKLLASEDHAARSVWRRIFDSIGRTERAINRLEARVEDAVDRLERLEALVMHAPATSTPPAVALPIGADGGAPGAATPPAKAGALFSPWRMVDAGERSPLEQLARKSATH